MSQEFDIEELLGSMMDQSGAGEQVEKLRRGARWWILVVLIVIGFFVVLRLMGIYSDWLWFASLGQQTVMRTQILAPLALFSVAFIVALLWLLGNWMYAVHRTAGRAVWPGQTQALPGAKMTRGLVAAVAVLMSLLVGAGLASAWPTFALYLGRSPFGRIDPIFGLDVSYYVFTLPMLGLLQSVLSSLVITALIGAVVIYAMGGLLELRHRVLRVPPGARAHLVLLGALWALVWAAGLWLSRYELLGTYRDSGVFFGPGYADIHVRLPALTALAVVAVVLAATLLVMIRSNRPWLPLAAIGVAILIRVVAVDVMPGLIQQYRVRPDELHLEWPYIENAIAGTRAAYDLDVVKELEYDPEGQVTAELIEANRGTFQNVRLWDWKVLLGMFEQIQEIRTYYRFLDVDLDRYGPPEEQHQVNLAVRELDVNELRNPTWVNRHLEFTHGFGVVVSPVNEVDSRGQAVLWAKDIPPVTVPPFDVEITQPRVYFGQAAEDSYVVVRTKAQEFDYPSGSDNVRSTYDGADGVDVGSSWRQLLYAISFGDIEILLSDAIVDESRILLYRNITERVQRLAPFLTYDADPYIVVTPDGRMVWIYDAYTSTDRYPYSQPVPSGGPELRDLAGLNYVRNSVKVVIDAYDGTTRFFVVDPEDPILKAWQRVFPTLFTTEGADNEMFREHWRYPEALLRAQAESYTRYHMSQPDVFYNAEDVWTVPRETREQGEKVPVEPYYVTMKLRGAEKPEFLLMLPFSPAEKQVMIGWLAARNDPPHYGELVVYRLAKGRRIDGPELVENRIDNDTEVSGQLTLWSQAGSRTIRGNLLVIPLEDTIMYVEPLYLAAEGSSFPELKRVIVASQEVIVMDTTLDKALRTLVARTEVGAAGGDGGERAIETEAEAQSDAQRESARTGEGALAPLPGSPEAAADLLQIEAETDVAALVQRARAHQDAARSALQRGDWESFGREMAALQAVIERLDELTGQGGGGAEPDATAEGPAGGSTEGSAEATVEATAEGGTP